jgi:hypothetical protein
LSAQDYLRVVKSGLFSNISIHEVIPFPDGNPGFIFVELTYLPDADRIIERRDQERRRPIVSNVYSHGQQLSIVHSKLDMGSIENVFDNNDETLIRGVVNPFFSRYLI